ncbi:MAG: hypothetical protein WAM60_25310 [Candidatus Promineifilaceae bacterium]
MTDFLALVNDILQAAIVVFGIAVALYNLPHSLRDRVTRAFNSLLFFVVIVYFTEVLVTRTMLATPAEPWLRLEWIGIAMVPAAQFHLADALLVTTGDFSSRRRLLVRVWYLVGVAFFTLALFSNWIIGELVTVSLAPRFLAGPLFLPFTVYYWLIAISSIYFVWRARERCLTYTTRRRMTMILITFLAAPLSVFPYLLFGGREVNDIPLFLWILLLAGNLVVAVMFSFLTYSIAYFGAVSPDRVVRVRLFKFMARVPLAAIIVLIVYISLPRAGSLIGLPVHTVQAMSIVGTIMLVEWAIYAFKRPLERLFQLTDEPEVRHIQELSERVLTTRDLQQFLESVLASTCEVLRTPSAFIASFTAGSPALEAVIGPPGEFESIWYDPNWQENWQALSQSTREASKEQLEESGDFLVWQNYWIRPLYNRHDEVLLGILGVKGRSGEPVLSEAEYPTFEQLVDQAANALEDRLLQQDVFASVEGLLPQITALQKRRSAAAFGGTPALTGPSIVSESKLISDPDFNSMVWDALSHYWGGPKLTKSPLVGLRIVQVALNENDGNPTKALRAILDRAIEQQRPEGERNMTTAEWILYNILELKFVQGLRVRDVARRLAMSESDLYRKQRVAIENVARTISVMELEVAENGEEDVVQIVRSLMLEEQAEVE